ncbi:MAG TPA: hypothetical protein VJ890_09385 [Vineibacter sp.]|nr:hypothetical protein [Vineibacter sp.]
MQAASSKIVVSRAGTVPVQRHVGIVWRRLRQASVTRHGFEVAGWIAFYFAIRVLTG